MQGHVDFISAREISGWAYDPLFGKSAPVLGPTAAMIMGDLDGFAQDGLFSGFRDMGVNNDLGAHAPAGYYRNVEQSWGYIHERWTEHFEIVSMHDAAIGNFQDAVVLRKRRRTNN